MPPTFETSRRDFFNDLFSEKNESLLNPFKHLSKQVASSLPPVESEVIHLNRTSFGIRPADYVRIKSIGIENYLEEQLDYQSIDNSELDGILDTVYPLVNYSLNEILDYIEEGNQMDEDRASDAAIQLISATIMRQLYSKHQLFEVMVRVLEQPF